MTIPRILHQTWKSAELDEPLSRFRESWPRLNPGLDCRFYSDQDCLSFVGEHFPSYMEIFTRLPYAVQRADFFRYLVVYKHGGIYADIDMECLRNFDLLFSVDAPLFCVERHVTTRTQARHDYRRPFQIANCIFMAPPRHRFVKKILECVSSLIRSGKPSLEAVEDVTGPRMLTRLYYQERPTDVRLLKQVVWVPWSFYPKFYPLNRNVFAAHHFLGSWKRPLPLMQRWRDRDIPPNPFGDLFHR